MFDHIFIDGEDNDKTTLADVIEQQRLQWVSYAHSTHSKAQRVRIHTDALMAARSSELVPKKVPVETRWCHSYVPWTATTRSTVFYLRTLDEHEPSERGIKDSHCPLGAGGSPSHSPATAAPLTNSHRPVWPPWNPTEVCITTFSPWRPFPDKVPRRSTPYPNVQPLTNLFRKSCPSLKRNLIGSFRSTSPMTVQEANALPKEGTSSTTQGLSQ